MRLYEYEGKILAARVGIPMPRGVRAESAEEAASFAGELGKPVAIKAQVLAGGRGKAGGIRFAAGAREVADVAESLLRSEIKGLKVNSLLVEEKLPVQNEFYVGITHDEIDKRSVLLLTRAGGVEVEEMAGEGVIREHLDPFIGLQPYKAKELAKKLGLGEKA